MERLFGKITKHKVVIWDVYLLTFIKHKVVIWALNCSFVQITKHKLVIWDVNLLKSQSIW
jgi:hypothetical protein